MTIGNLAEEDDWVDFDEDYNPAALTPEEDVAGAIFATTSDPDLFFKSMGLEFVGHRA